MQPIPTKIFVRALLASREAQELLDPTDLTDESAGKGKGKGKEKGESGPKARSKISPTPLTTVEEETEHSYDHGSESQTGDELYDASESSDAASAVEEGHRIPMSIDGQCLDGSLNRGNYSDDDDDAKPANRELPVLRDNV